MDPFWYLVSSTMASYIPFSFLLIGGQNVMAYAYSVIHFYTVTSTLGGLNLFTKKLKA